MSTVEMPTPAPLPTRADDGDFELSPAGRVLIAALSAGAGAIHLAMVAPHAADSTTDGVLFAVSGWVQLIIAFALFTRPTRRLLQLNIALNVVLALGWAMSRTVGLPFSHGGAVEDIGRVDLTCVLFEVALIVGSAVLLARPTVGERLHRTGLSLAAGLPVLVVMGLTTAALASPGATHSHDHGTGVAADGHDHSHAAADPTEAAQVNADRCDKALNIKGYFQEATLAGVDTTFGGGGHDDHGAPGDHSQMTPEEHAKWLKDQAAQGAAATPAAGEAADAATVIKLSNMSDAEYEAFIADLNPANRDPNAPDDNGGHGGHVGPQPWTAITDRATCTQLADEVATARKVALSYPTPTDAMAAGYTPVTSYVPGIAAHYMNFSLVDGFFEVDKPEMILYDSNLPDANVVGLSYYLLHEGTDEPTQGFSGDDDHFHRHVGLCVRGTMVIGDSTTTKEDCEARGGQKQGGDAGWMSHAWVVPGCESPWGIFSGANPILDGTLGAHSGEGSPCSGSGVLDRYDMNPASSTGGGDGQQAAGN